MKKSVVFLCIVLLAFSISGVAIATPIEMIANGGFETGNFSGWSIDSAYWAINNGTFNPPGPGNPTAPIAGSYDAVTYQPGPDFSMLSNWFVVPDYVFSATVSWTDRIRNYWSRYQEDYQEFEVWLYAGGSNYEIFSTNPGDPLIQVGPNARSYDLTTILQSHLGQSARLSFQTRVNGYFMNVNIDDVSLLVDPVPEPATMFLLGSGLIGLAGFRRKVKK